jgi:hypothetical protein
VVRYPFALADTEVGPEPRYADFPSLETYTAAWHYWRAVRRDAYPVRAEQDTLNEVLEWWFREIDRRRISPAPPGGTPAVGALR